MAKQTIILVRKKHFSRNAGAYHNERFHIMDYLNFRNKYLRKIRTHPTEKLPRHKAQLYYIHNVIERGDKVFDAYNHELINLNDVEFAENGRFSEHWLDTDDSYDSGHACMAVVSDEDDFEDTNSELEEMEYDFEYQHPIVDIFSCTISGVVNPNSSSYRRFGRVIIQNVEGNIQIPTIAMFDSGANVTLIDSVIRKQAYIKGKRGKLGIQGVNAVENHEDFLTVRSITSDKEDC